MTKTNDAKKGLGTLAVHGGYDPQEHYGSTNIPIFSTAAYQFTSSDHAASLFNLEQEGFIYSRIGNPTTDALERRLAELEGGVGALLTSSGQSSILLSILNIAEAGDEIVASSSLYGGTITLFSYTFKRMGINVHFVNQANLGEWEEKINEKTKAFFLESISNPALEVAEMEKIAQIAHDHGIPLIVDNTFATPVLFRPLEHGADIVIHSATKYIGGHGNAIAGLIIDGGKFSWDNGKFPGLSQPDPAYHGFCYTEEAGKLAYMTKLKAQLNRDIGATISPYNAFLLSQGLGTLHLRMERQSENAKTIAAYLEQHDGVEWVKYPGLKSHPSYSIASKYFRHGFGGILTFGVKGGYVKAKQLIDKVKIFTHAANIGDIRSLIIHPASTTHQQLTDEEKIAAGVGNDLIRVSVGIENIEDLLSDLEQALND